MQPQESDRQVFGNLPSVDPQHASGAIAERQISIHVLDLRHVLSAGVGAQGRAENPSEINVDEY
jgi:hypothetical protein